MEGVKYDKGKRAWSLLPWDVLGGVVDVLQFGAKKYDANNWRYMRAGKRRYFDAFMRHYLAVQGGEELDPETGLHHAYHMCCNALFLCYFMTKERHEQRSTEQRTDRGLSESDRPLP